MLSDSRPVPECDSPPAVLIACDVVYQCVPERTIELSARVFQGFSEHQSTRKSPLLSIKIRLKNSKIVSSKTVVITALTRNIMP